MGTMMVVCSEDGQKITRYLRRLAPSLLEKVALAAPGEENASDERPSVAVVDSSDTDALHWVSQRNLPAITCGFHNRDTLTLSSITAESAAICLLRALRTIEGRTIEPMEFPVTLSGRPAVYPILATAAVLLLAGAEERLLSAGF